MPRQATFVTKNQKTGDFSAHGSQSVKKVALGVTALSALSGINAIAGQSSQVFAIDPTTYDGFEYATKKFNRLLERWFHYFQFSKHRQCDKQYLWCTYQVRLSLVE